MTNRQLPPIFDIDISRIRDDEEIIVMPNGDIWIYTKLAQPEPETRMNYPAFITWGLALVLWGLIAAIAFWLL